MVAMKKILLFAAVATMFAACTKDATKDLAPAKPIEKFYAVIGEEESRVQLNGEGKTVWTKGDKVSVFNKTTDNCSYAFTGNTGDSEGELSYVEGGTAGDEIDQIVALYPYNATNEVAWNGKLKTAISSMQTYCKDSYGIGNNIMVARSDNDKLSFRNVLGWIRIALTGEKTIKSITLQGNNNESIAGDITIKQNMSVTMMSGGTAAITLDCGDGVALSQEEPTYFYFALQPQTFEKGISVAITDSNGYKVELKKLGSITVARNHIVPMVSFDCTIKENVSAYQIAYTTSGNEPITPQSYTGNIVSHIFESGRGVITFDSEQTEIGNYAFRDCTSLTGITIGNGVTKIGWWSFYGCKGLTSVILPNSVTIIDGFAFFNCKGLTSIRIPDSVITISNSAFYNCEGLTSITIPNSVTAIENSAFANCSSLTSVILPDSITKISGTTFSGAGLTSITIPDSVTEIGNSAFEECRGLINVYCKASTPPTLGENAFIYWNIEFSSMDFIMKNLNCTIYVPRASVEAYKSAPDWKDYESQIVGYDF